MSHEVARDIIQHQIDMLEKGGPMGRPVADEIANYESGLARARQRQAEEAAIVADLRRTMALLVEDDEDGAVL